MSISANEYMNALQAFDKRNNITSHGIAIHKNAAKQYIEVHPVVSFKNGMYRRASVIELGRKAKIGSYDCISYDLAMPLMQSFVNSIMRKDNDIFGNMLHASLSWLSVKSNLYKHMLEKMWIKDLLSLNEDVIARKSFVGRYGFIDIKVLSKDETIESLLVFNDMQLDKLM